MRSVHTTAWLFITISISSAAYNDGGRTERIDLGSLELTSRDLVLEQDGELIEGTALSL